MEAFLSICEEQNLYVGATGRADRDETDTVIDTVINPVFDAVKLRALLVSLLLGACVSAQSVAEYSTPVQLDSVQRTATQGVTATAEPDKTPLFPLGALEPGQRGYGLSAGAGNVIERFEVEVLALQYDAGTGFPLVLVRASGPLIDAAGGIASGMSGSPVYLERGGEDALLGAVGFTFPETSGGLGLVTPIATMRRADPRAAPVRAFGPAFDPQDAVPVRTPLLITGLSARAGTLLSPLFSGEMVPLPLQATGGQTPERVRDDAAYRLEPGAAISAQLIRGDVTVAAVGTLTLVESGAFWAFGHPLLGRGAVSFALAPAFVTAVVPSRNVPFKLADSGRRVLGSVTQDRPYAISGLLGEKPDFIPVTLSLSGDAGTLTKRFEVTDDERFYAPLLASATLQAFDELLQGTAGGTAELAWEIELAGGRTVRVLEQATSAGDLALAAADLAAEPLGLFSDNPFQKAQVTRVSISAGYERAERVAELVEVVPERTNLKPGAALSLNLRLQPFRQGPQVERLSVRLPPELRGPVTLTVRGGLTPPEDEGEGRALYSFAELLSALEENVQSSELVVETAIDGETRVLKRLSLPYLVAGSEGVEVTVRGKGKPGAAPRTPQAPDPEALDDQTPDELPEDDPLEERPPLEPSAPGTALPGIDLGVGTGHYR